MTSGFDFRLRLLYKEGVTASIARPLEDARRRRGLSKRAYAKLVGISRQSLYNLLSGTVPSLSTYVRLVELGDVPAPQKGGNGHSTKSRSRRPALAGEDSP